MTLCAACREDRRSRLYRSLRKLPGSGALGAPKYGNKADWGKRNAQGFDTVVKNATNGIRAMPPRGGNPDLSDIEMSLVVAYMANAAGASFKPK